MVYTKCWGRVEMSNYSTKTYTDTEMASIEAAVKAAIDKARLRDRLEGPITHYIIEALAFGEAGFGKYTSGDIGAALRDKNQVVGLEFVSDYKYKIPANQISNATKGILFDENVYVRFEIVREIRTPNTASTGGRRRTRKTRRVKRKGTKAKKSRQSRQSRR